MGDNRGGAAVAISIAAAVLMQGEGYRSIAIEQLVGTVTVVGSQNNGQAYVGQHLYSGDDVTVGDSSELTMCMDNDKYVYADSNTHFLLEASAADEDSRIKIFLNAGSELNVLNSQLAENETYEVDTPNSTMSVRGTTFRVTVYTAADGMTYTLTEVTEGTVRVRLKTSDGKYNGIEQDFTAGQSALIRGNNQFSEFVTSGMLNTSDLDMDDMDVTERLLLAYGELPADGMERLIELLKRNGFIDEADTGKNEATKTLPTPSVIPTPEANIDATVTPTAGETPAPSVYERTYNEWVVGTDSETGGYILKDATIFDPVYYAQHNPDVVVQYGNDPKALLYHWITLGRGENRPPSERAAQAQEEAFRSFAKMLDDEYAEEMRQQQASARSGGSSGNNNGAVPGVAPVSISGNYSYDSSTNPYYQIILQDSNGNDVASLWFQSADLRVRNLSQNGAPIEIDMTNPISITDTATNTTRNFSSLENHVDYGGSDVPLTVTKTINGVTYKVTREEDLNNAGQYIETIYENGSLMQMPAGSSYSNPNYYNGQANNSDLQSMIGEINRANPGLNL